MIKGVIFDMDGVLVDNRHMHERSFKQWCDNHSVVMPDNFLDNFSGRGNDDIFPAVMHDQNLSKATIDRYATEKEQIYRELYADEIQPVAGLIPLLEELQRRGIKIAVGSSAIIANVDFVLKSCGIERFFSVIANGDRVKKAKPAPDIFLLAASDLGLAPQECFVFEDAFAGIEAARAAGMRVGVLATTFARELHKDYDILLDDFTQVTVDDILN